MSDRDWDLELTLFAERAGFGRLETVPGVASVVAAEGRVLHPDGGALPHGTCHVWEH